MKALQGLAQLPLAKRASVPARRGTRKVTPGHEMTLGLDGETQKSKVAPRARKPRQ